ncbi:MAG TPA: peptide chain release factor N(5)-glutamine methyltransferase [Ignavibacteria bacterium]|nr:peptide chain release factor N(5)-glutamine methyltransferase [Ignavibacteria bacterium]
MPENNSNVLTVIDILRKTVSELELSGIKDSRINAELLLCEIMKCSRLDLYINYEKPLSRDELIQFNHYLKRRLNNEPLQYITGRTNFFGYEIMLDRNVLIPRQETELLAERTIEDVISSEKKNISIFEIGTGSGCLAVALAKRLTELETGYEIFSIDISENAIETARSNLKLNGIEDSRITLYKKDMFEIERLKKNYDYIISNPPYISLDDWKELPDEIKKFEPMNALTDESDGFKFYRKIFEIYSDKDFTGKAFCEIGFGQKETLVKILDKYQTVKYTFYKDYSEIDRIIKLEKC